MIISQFFLIVQGIFVLATYKIVPGIFVLPTYKILENNNFALNNLLTH